MDTLINFIIENQQFAPWIVFTLILLAGFNIPISTDVILVLSAFLAATTIPQHTIPLYISVAAGSYFSAWICYWVGRTLGIKLLRFHYFSKLLPKNRLEKVGAFYEKHGLLTLIIGRFIPFGVRNCIFMTTGISKGSFKKFIARDAIACPLWATISFLAFFHLGQNYHLLLKRVKTLNLFIFLAFGVTVIAILWYKRYKRKQNSLVEHAKSSE